MVYSSRHGFPAVEQTSHPTRTRPWLPPTPALSLLRERAPLAWPADIIVTHSRYYIKPFLQESCLPESQTGTKLEALNSCSSLFPLDRWTDRQRDHTNEHIFISLSKHHHSLIEDVFLRWHLSSVLVGLPTAEPTTIWMSLAGCLRWCSI